MQKDNKGYKKYQVLLLQFVINDIIDLSREHKLIIMGGNVRKTPDSPISTVVPISREDEIWLKQIISTIVRKGAKGSTGEFLDVVSDDLEL